MMIVTVSMVKDSHTNCFGNSAYFDKFHLTLLPRNCGDKLIQDQMYCYTAKRCQEGMDLILNKSNPYQRSHQVQTNTHSFFTKLLDKL
jgi:hypothetical protein